MLWLLLPPSVTLAGALVVAERCRRLYCQIAECRARLTDADTTEHPAETP